MIEEDTEERIAYRVFDWTRAETMLREHQPSKAYAGIQESWRDTAALIWENGDKVKARLSDDKPVIFCDESKGTPCLQMDGITYDCYTERNLMPPSFRMLWPSHPDYRSQIQ